MIATWSEWKCYPRAVRGEQLEAPIGPGIYEVRYASSGALFASPAEAKAAGIETVYTIPNQKIEFHVTKSPLRQGSYRALASTAKAEGAEVGAVAREALVALPAIVSTVRRT